MTDLAAVNVLVPDQFGTLTVCSLDSLVAALDDGEDLEEAVTNSGFDQIEFRRKTVEQIQNLVGLVARLNAEPGWGGYWERGD